MSETKTTLQCFADTVTSVSTKLENFNGRVIAKISESGEGNLNSQPGPVIAAALASVVLEVSINRTKSAARKLKYSKLKKDQ